MLIIIHPERISGKRSKKICNPLVAAQRQRAQKPVGAYRDVSALALVEGGSPLAKGIPMILLFAFCIGIAQYPGSLFAEGHTARGLLDLARQGQMEYKQENGQYATRIEELGVSELMESTWQLDVLVAEGEFWLEAVDNLDTDRELDTWSIDSAGTVRHEIDDRDNRRNVEHTARETVRQKARADYLAWREVGDYSRAVSSLEKETRRKYGDRLRAELFVELVGVYAEVMNRPERALAVLRLAQKEKVMDADAIVRALASVASGYKVVGDKKKALVLYERIIEDYPNREFPGGGVASSSAEREIIILTQTIDWLRPNDSALVEELWRLLMRRDREQLRKLASRSNFQLSYKGRNGDYTPFDLAIDSFLEYAGNAALKRDRISCREDRSICFLPTRGYGGQHRTVYLIIARQEGGWEWRGFVYGKMSAADIKKIRVLPIDKNSEL